MSEVEQALTIKLPMSEEEQVADTQRRELNQLTTNLAMALKGLLGQAAVDGADAEEINPRVVFAANSALQEYKRHPVFNLGDDTLPPTASKLSNGEAVQLLGLCVRDLLPLAENELETMKLGVHSDPEILGPELETAREKVERSRQALYFLNHTDLGVIGLPSDHLDDQFEIRFKWE